MQVNGENFPLKDLKEPTMEALLSHLRLAKEHVAIEYNKNILPKKNYRDTVLNDDDIIEILHFVGGG